MFGAIIGELAAFPYVFQKTDLMDRSIPLLREPAEAGRAEAGRDFSAAVVMTAAFQDGLLRFQDRLPVIAGGGRGEAPAGETAGKAGREEAPAGETAGKAGREEAPAGETAGKAGREEAPAGETAGKAGREEAPAGEKTDKAGSAPGGVNISANLLETVFAEELAGAMRRFGRAMPFAGYPVDLSIWLNRADALPAQTEDAGPAARVSPVAWMFQDDLYMMRHLAVMQAGLTNRGRETARAADAAASAVFLALHGCTKDYIAGFMERQFGYRIPEEAAMRQELLQAAPRAVPSPEGPEGDGRGLLPSLYVRAGMTAFLYGRDFEDVIRRAVSLGGGNTETAAIAGSVAEAFFGIPQQILDDCRSRLPEEILRAADAFAAMVDWRKKRREENPAAKARWESALMRASSNHPAAVQGNEPLERAIGVMREKKDQQSFAAALRALQARMRRKGRVFVPVSAVRRAERPAGGAPARPGTVTTAAGTGMPGADAVTTAAGTGMPAERIGNGAVPEAGQAAGAVYCRMQAVRTRDGKLWQPAFTSRAQLELARRQAAASGEGVNAREEMVLSYALEALLRRFRSGAQDNGRIGADAAGSAGSVPPEVEGIVLNPYGDQFFLPRRTIDALLATESPRNPARGARDPEGSE